MQKDYLGHRKRIKEKYKKAGVQGWMNYEILELLLSYSIPRKDTKPIAKQLMAKYKNLQGVLNAGTNELVETNGISEHSAILINLVKDVAVEYQKEGLKNKDLLSSPDAVCNYLLTTMKGLGHEEFHVLFLDSKNGLIKSELLQKGVVNKSVVFPRQIVEKALINKACRVIIAHNHPSGDVKPSNEDKKITEIIRDALKLVEIDLLDHIIVGGNKYFSFKTENIGA